MRKNIITLLLKGYYLVPWINANGVKVYRLYDPSGNPDRNVGWKTVQTMDRFIDPKIRIWKKDKIGRMTLSPRNILRLRKNNWIKQQYKKLNQNKNEKVRDLVGQS